MPLPDEFRGLAPDAAVPQRDLLLDEVAVAPRIARWLGVQCDVHIERCRRVWTNYSIARRMRVRYEVVIDGQSYDVVAFTYADHDAATREHAQAPAATHDVGALRGVALDDEMDVVYWTLPNDRRVTGFDVLDRPPLGLSRRLLRPWVASEIVAYAPERAVTGRCLDAEGRTLAFAKFFGHEPGKEIAWAHEQLYRAVGMGDPHLRVPRVLDYSARHRVLLLEALPGRRVSDVPDPELAPVLVAFGSALARLHDVPAGGWPEAERPDLLRAARLLARTRPDVAGTAHRLALALGARERDAQGPVTLHGDLRLTNGLEHDGRVGLIDLDQIGQGPAAADLGRVLAFLRYRRVVGELSAFDEGRLAGALLDGYAAVRALPCEAELRWHMAAVLLCGRALGAVKWLKPDRLEHLAQLLDAGLEVLGGNDMKAVAA